MIRCARSRSFHTLMAVDRHPLITAVFGGGGQSDTAYLLFVGAITPANIFHVALAVVTVVAVGPAAVGPHAAVQFGYFLLLSVDAAAVDPPHGDFVIVPASFDIVVVVGGGCGAVDFAGGSVLPFAEC